MNIHLTRDPRTTEVSDDEGILVERVIALRGVVLSNGRARGQVVTSFNNAEITDADGIALKPGDTFEIALRDIEAIEYGLSLHHVGQTDDH